MKHLSLILLLLFAYMFPANGDIVPDDQLVEVELHMPTPSNGIPKAPCVTMLSCYYNITNQELYLLGNSLDFSGTTIIVSRCDNNNIVYSNIVSSSSLHEVIQLPASYEFQIMIMLPSGITLMGTVTE